MGILGLTIYFGSLDMEIIFSLLDPNDKENIGILTMITLAILVGIMSKSAQFGLHQWLPDAMEGELGSQKLPPKPYRDKPGGNKRGGKYH
jgi:NADH-quinone oxidoreductase subunit L